MKRIVIKLGDGIVIGRPTSDTTIGVSLAGVMLLLLAGMFLVNL